ncbi:MAG: hypothetical protein K6G69_09960 [Lachnospiraceae bacterium]|nr:hypothetical protein [Lachnospiraceae bacterium]
MMNLEIEYKNLIDSELPDLWSKIEAGVDAYEASKKDNNDVQIIKTESIEEKKTADTSEESVLNDKPVLIRKAKRKQTIMTIGKIVAAAAVLFIVVNSVRLFNGTKNMTPSADYANDTAMADGSYATAESAAEAPAMADESDDNGIIMESEEAVEAMVEEEADDAVPGEGMAEASAPETDAKNSETQTYNYKGEREKQGIKADETEGINGPDDYMYINRLSEIMPGLELATLVDISKSLYELKAGNIVEVSEATEVSEQDRKALPDEVKTGIGNNEKLIHETLTDDKGITYDLYMAESDEMRFVALYKVEKTE